MGTDNRTVDEIQAALSRREIDCRDLIAECLHRIAAHDRRGPHLNAVITIAPDVLEQADRARPGRLQGIPVVVKDVVATAGPMPTTGGSLALAGLRAPADATIVRRIRAEGGIVVAKANLDELTMGGTGESALGGQARNPYALDRSPSGSSGGTAVAIAAGYGVLGIGTDTCGSVRSPAASNNLVGLRPTLGLVSRAGIMPAARTSDTAGPMTRTVADAAVLLDAIAGADRRDPATLAADGHIPATYTRFLVSNGLTGARIGIARSLFGDSPTVNHVMDAAIVDMAAHGAHIVDPVVLHHAERMDFTDLPYRGTFEMQVQFDAYLAELGDAAPVQSFAEIARIGSPLPAIQAGLHRRLAHTSLTDPEYLDILRRGTRWSREGIDAAMRDHDLDALLYPTRRSPPEPAGTLDPQPANGILAAVSGYPAITVPAGFTPDGLPVGVELLGRPWSEPTLLRLAHAYEQATHHRRPPNL